MNVSEISSMIIPPFTVLVLLCVAFVVFSSLSKSLGIDWKKVMQNIMDLINKKKEGKKK